MKCSTDTSSRLIGTPAGAEAQGGTAGVRCPDSLVANEMWVWIKFNLTTVNTYETCHGCDITSERVMIRSGWCGMPQSRRVLHVGMPFGASWCYVQGGPNMEIEIEIGMVRDVAGMRGGRTQPLGYVLGLRN